MAEYFYYIIEFDGRGDMLEPVNPRILFENGRCLFSYDGPDPGWWGSHIRRRHGLSTEFDVKWHLDRKPGTPPERIGYETRSRPPVFLARQ